MRARSASGVGAARARARARLCVGLSPLVPAAADRPSSLPPSAHLSHPACCSKEKVEEFDARLTVCERDIMLSASLTIFAMSKDVAELKRLAQASAALMAPPPPPITPEVRAMWSAQERAAREAAEKSHTELEAREEARLKMVVEQVRAAFKAEFTAAAGPDSDLRRLFDLEMAKPATRAAMGSSESKAAELAWALGEGLSGASQAVAEAGDDEAAAKAKLEALMSSALANVCPSFKASGEQLDVLVAAARGSNSQALAILKKLDGLRKSVNAQKLGAEAHMDALGAVDKKVDELVAAAKSGDRQAAAVLEKLGSLEQQNAGLKGDIKQLSDDLQGQIKDLLAKVKELAAAPAAAAAAPAALPAAAPVAPSNAAAHTGGAAAVPATAAAPPPLSPAQQQSNKIIELVASFSGVAKRQVADACRKAAEESLPATIGALKGQRDGLVKEAEAKRVLAAVKGVEAGDMLAADVYAAEVKAAHGDAKKIKIAMEHHKVYEATANRLLAESTGLEEAADKAAASVGEVAALAETLSNVYLEWLRRAFDAEAKAREEEAEAHRERSVAFKTAAGAVEAAVLKGGKSFEAAEEDVKHAHDDEASAIEQRAADELNAAAQASDAAEKDFSEAQAKYDELLAHLEETKKTQQAHVGQVKAEQGALFAAKEKERAAAYAATRWIESRKPKKALTYEEICEELEACGSDPSALATELEAAKKELEAERKAADEALARAVAAAAAVTSAAEKAMTEAVEKEQRIIATKKKNLGELMGVFERAKEHESSVRTRAETVELSAREIRERAMANPDPLSKPAKQMLADRLVGHRAPSGVAGAGAGAVSSPIDEVLNALDAAREKLGGALPRAFQARKRAGAEKKTPDGKLVPVLPAERMKQRADELAFELALRDARVGLRDAMLGVLTEFKSAVGSLNVQVEREEGERFLAASAAWTRATLEAGAWTLPAEHMRVRYGIGDRSVLMGAAPVSIPAAGAAEYFGFPWPIAEKDQGKQCAVEVLTFKSLDDGPARAKAVKEGAAKLGHNIHSKEWDHATSDFAMLPASLQADVANAAYDFCGRLTALQRLAIACVDDKKAGCKHSERRQKLIDLLVAKGAKPDPDTKEKLVASGYHV